MAFYNLARMYTETTGTGTVTLTTAVPGCLTFDLAGVSNGATVQYSIITYDTDTHRATHTEVGTGTYTASGTTLTRTTVEKSTNSNNKITLTGLSEVMLAPLASDFNGFGGSGGVSFASYKNNGAADTATASGGSVDPINLDTEVIDADSIATLASDVITVAGSGYYLCSLQLNIVSDGAITANGTFTIEINTTGGDIYTNVPVVNGINYTDGVFFLQGLVSLSATNVVSASFTNNTNKDIDVYIYELTLLKLS